MESGNKGNDGAGAVYISGEDVRFKLDRLFRIWNTGYSTEESPFYNIDAIILLTGKSSNKEEEATQKLEFMQLWLTGFEFPETLFVFTRNETWIALSSPKKISYLEQIKNCHDKIILLTRNTEDGNTANIEKMMYHLKQTNASKVTLGYADMSPRIGTFYEQMQSAFASFDSKEISAACSMVMAVRSASDYENTKAASVAASAILKHKLVNHIENVLDFEREETHASIAALVNNIQNDPKMWDKLKDKFGVDSGEVEIVHANVQSGDSFDLRVGAPPTEKALSQTEGSIIISLGVKYKEYCANIVRTLILNGKKEHKGVYIFALEVMEAVIHALKSGQKCSEVYHVAKQYIQENKPNLLDKFVKSVGHVVGVEFRDKNYALTPKNDFGVLESGMALNISIGFNGVKGTGGSTFAVWIAETVFIPPAGEATILTDLVSKRLEHISYELDEEEDKADVKEEKSRPKAHSSSNGSISAAVINNADTVILSDRLRRRAGVHQHAAQEAEEQNARQNELRKRKLTEIKERFEQGENASGNQKHKSVMTMTSIKCFEDAEIFPRDLVPNRLYVDPRSESLLVPMNGVSVPFHVSTIKNVTCNPEDGQKYYTFRINFQVPGSQTLTSKGEDNPLPELSGPNALFMKELLYRSEDGKHLQAVFRNVKELIKRVKLKEAEQDVARDLADQEKLQLNRSGRRVLLKDLLVRPPIQGSRKIIGTLEAHPNGLRFSFNARLLDCVDITYSNIKHAFFQPCERELIVLIHFHLKSPIMVGKKKTHDVQFYTETGTQADDLDNRKGPSFHDPDETQDELRELEMKKRLNSEFKRFYTQVEEISRLEFEIPFRGLMFSGVPAKSNVEIMPTANCLVHLIEWPPFVLPLEDIEIVSLERVQHGLKEFDMVFVFKDFTKPVKKIDLVPVGHLDNIKKWLNELEIVWYEGKNNLQWNNILKTIMEDTESFLEQGGFEGFLGEETEEEEEEEEEEDDLYSGSESESASDEESDEDDSEDESLADESDDESYQDVDSGEEEGLSWDELEERAKKDDRKHLYDAGEESSHRMKKKKKTA